MIVDTDPRRLESLYLRLRAHDDYVPYEAWSRTFNEDTERQTIDHTGALPGGGFVWLAMGVNDTQDDIHINLPCNEKGKNAMIHLTMVDGTLNAVEAQLKNPSILEPAWRIKVGS